MNIIECAIKMKEARRDHYTQLAGYASDKDLKRLGQLLAEANNELINQLNEFRDNLEDALLAAADLSEEVCVFSPRFDVQHPEVSLGRDSDAYLHVVREIENAVKFYEQLAEKAETEKIKTVFLKLADIERAHLTVVENIYSFVEDPRTYLEWGEFSNLKSL